MNTKAVAYYRRSTDRQEQSIGDQRKAVEARPAENDSAIIREYVEWAQAQPEVPYQSYAAASRVMRQTEVVRTVK